VAPVEPEQVGRFEKGDKVAVVVGVGAYPTGSGLRPLAWAARDADDVGRELERLGYVAIVRKDAGATRGVVLNTLANVKETLAGPNSTLLFYFSGHGFMEDGANYVATYEAARGHLSTTGLRLDEIEEALKATGAQRQVMLIDACRNDPEGKGGGVRSFGALSLSAGLRGLLSTKEGGVSYESDELRHGVFTHFLLEALRGAAAGADGLVTFRDLSDYVVDGVRQWGLKQDQPQVPRELAKEAGGDFLLARAASASSGAAPLDDRGEDPGHRRAPHGVDGEGVDGGLGAAGHPERVHRGPEGVRRLDRAPDDDGRAAQGDRRGRVGHRQGGEEVRR